MVDQLGERTELVEDLVDRLSQAADGDADEVELILWNSGDSCTVRLVVRCCEQSRVKIANWSTSRASVRS